MSAREQPASTPTPPMVPFPAQRAGESSYLGDPMLDRLLGIVTELAAELWVTKDRQRALEDVLTRRGIDVDTELSTYQPRAEREELLRAERERFVSRIFKDVTAST